MLSSSNNSGVMGKKVIMMSYSKLPTEKMPSAQLKEKWQPIIICPSVILCYTVIFYNYICRSLQHVSLSFSVFLQWEHVLDKADCYWGLNASRCRFNWLKQITNALILGLSVPCESHWSEVCVCVWRGGGHGDEEIWGKNSTLTQDISIWKRFQSLICSL